MDIFSHGLWAGVAAKAVNKSSVIAGKIKRPLKVWYTVLWGVFPDLFAFALPFVWMFWNIIFGDLKFSDFPRPETVEPAVRDTLPVFQIASGLYNISHSLIVFVLVFALIWFFLRRIPWEMSGWFLHVLIDIPTHSYKFYPTPFLWPISEWKFDGFSWGVPWFIILNYSAIILAYWFLRRRKSKTRKLSMAILLIPLFF